MEETKATEQNSNSERVASYVVGRVFTVYKGELGGKIVYIGTTIQIPEDRFRWHKYNGKDFRFTVLHQFDNEKEMLDKEYELIKLYNPRYNKIKHRKQNLNVKLTQEELNKRIGDKNWCQKFLKRQVNSGYKYCYYCS